VKHVPEWLPGAEFQRKAKTWRSRALEIFDWPLEEAKRMIVRHFYEGIFKAVLTRCQG
jgi:hypothetical protein